MPQNIKLVELLGNEFRDINYAVTTNWRIDFSNCRELKNLMGDVENDPIKQMSFACHSNFQFKTDIEYAEATIKGMHISQAAWQDRFIDSLPIDIYENMDHRIFKALMSVANNTAGYFQHRNINEKKEYTFSGITLEALGNSSQDGEVESKCIYHLLGVQVNSIESPEYTSDNADIGSVQLDIRAHGWTIGDGNV
jgi:hypothetical protein